MLINLFIALIAKFAVANAATNLTSPQISDPITTLVSGLSKLVSGLFPSETDIKLCNMRTVNCQI